MNIDENTMQEIARIMQVNPNIAKLELSNNNLRLRGIQFLAEAI